ncbi:alpha/beta fold hydrolase [Halapricum salinum]|uniref:Alpha/beta fold hydrolase n=1 Tax=Halapricum salinum TaxID=1457250 RepID=A0A4D6HFG3_9EURY|nr:alpha/beta hydrolase [Halapricum salinum]QCC52759.1 alpha/beta fold hydrolase [Halapricum salinum]
MPTANNDGVAIAYERDGLDDAETIVFVEGLGYGRWMWRWQRAQLQDHYDLLLFDNRGTGDSAEPDGPYTIGEMAGDLEAVLADAGVERAHVVGASMGGMIAMQYALEYDRAASLGLFCTSPGGPDAAPTPEETRSRMYDVPENLGEREAIKYKMEPALSETFPEQYDDVFEEIVDWRLESDASEQARQWQGAAVEAFDISDRLDEITLPALVIHGTGDKVVPPENGELLAESLPNSRYLTLHDAPHLFCIEEFLQVNEHLDMFIRDV